jgi:dolichol-phosphate mannosyltransferase
MNDSKEYPVAVVVIPTYNEADNIGLLLDEFFNIEFPKIKNWNVKVLIVDGKSPDGTGQIVLEKSKKHKNIHLLVEEKKQGIGAAYITGFKKAMTELGADVVIEFDADFQHPPRYVGLLLKEIDEGYDYVLGSRKIKGGSETYQRNIIRSLLTSFGSIVAKCLLFFPTKMFWQVTDTTTGLKATRVKGFMNKLNLDPNHLHSKKFGYKIQLLSETLHLGAKYKEIPLAFDDRYAGVSKFESTTMFEVLLACIKTRLHEDNTRRFIKFAVVGLVGYIINALSLDFMHSITKIESLSWAISTELAIISNFIFNNVWTFKLRSISNPENFFKRLLKFNSTSFGALLIQVIIGTSGVYLFGEDYRQIILVFTSFLIVPFYNWYMYNRFIWRK